MKIRTAYVANSSTTCFTVLGASFDLNKVIDEICDDKTKLNKFLNHIPDGYDEADIFRDMDTESLKKYFKDNFKNVFDSIGMDTYGGNYPDIGWYCIGLEPSSRMKDDQTLKDFKAQALRMLLERGIDVSDVKWIEEAHYQG